MSRKTVLGRKPFLPDQLDRKLFEAFPGLVMRKDLTLGMRMICKAPSYVIEFLMGKYCNDLFDDAEVQDDLRLALEEVADSLPRSDETELIKAPVRGQLTRKIMDKVRIELDESLVAGMYWASLEHANLQKVSICAAIVEKHERLLMSGVWSRIILGYDGDICYDGKTYPFDISRLDPIQISGVSLQEYLAGRERFTSDEWIDVLVLLQLHVINSQEFGTTELIYIDRESDQVHVVKIEV